MENSNTHAWLNKLREPKIVTDFIDDRSLQAGGNCNALWPRGQDGDPTIWSFDSYHHCVGCNSPSLDVQHKSTPKSEMQLQGKSSNEEIRKPGHISEENAVGPYEKIGGNGELEGGNSSNHGKSHILRSEGERQELLFRGINSWKDRKNERRDHRDIQHEQTSREREKKPVPWGVSLDGTVWELSDLDSPEECNSHPSY
ncbi:unnamed protein product [Rhizophagus irregularis]|nr:unnamed protein product [Rhizophagus irregularis]